MRADRLLSILLLLQTQGRLTARDLAARLEVSERTIHRDMEALSAAGIPVIAERGTGGGWSLMDNYRTNLTGFKEAEIQALFLAQPPRLLADLGLEAAAENAVLKLLAALPSARRHNADYIRQRIYVDALGWQKLDEDISALPVIQEALWDEQQLALLYRRADGVAVERVVHPLGLVAKGSVWYLVATVEGEIRTYRVSRVQDSHVVDEPATRPSDFDLAAYWEQSKAEFVANLPRYPATLRLNPERLPFLKGWRFARIEYLSPREADGWITASVQFELESEACGYILSGGDQIEVLEPPELRERVRQTAREIAARYEMNEQPL
ncbi:MAG TPA: YafY family protein [Phototrophicaceae bacterium]|nr:YafY family protein [Phototrophicaceae bacterium]